MRVNTGLQSLADAYGLERGGAAEFRALAHRFSELFADNLARMVARRIRLVGGVSLSLESFAEYFATPAQQTFIIKRPGAEHVAVRVDPELKAALVRGALGAKQGDGGSQSAGEASTTRVRLTPAEIRFARRLLQDALGASARAAFESSGGSAPVIAEGAAEMAETSDPLAKMAVAAGRLALNDCEAGFALGAPLAALPAPHFHAEARQARLQKEGEASAMRARLGGARMSLAAVLGSVELPFDAVRKLEPGSIIVLGALAGPAPRVELRYGALPLCAGTVIEECGWHRFLVQVGGSN